MIDTFAEVIVKSPILAIFIVFWAGFIASVSSCTLIRIPIVLGYVSGAGHTKKKSLLLAVCLAAGIIFSYTFLGIFLTALKNLTFGLVHISRYVYTVLGIILFIMGIFYAGLIRIRTTHRAECKTDARIKKRSFWGAFLFGLMFAFLEMPACPCCASVLFVIAGVVSLCDSWFYSFVIFLSFAVGQSLPILLIGSSTTLVKHLAPRAEKMEKYIQFAAGNILIAMAILFFILA